MNARQVEEIQMEKNLVSFLLSPHGGLIQKKGKANFLREFFQKVSTENKYSFPIS